MAHITKITKKIFVAETRTNRENHEFKMFCKKYGVSYEDFKLYYPTPRDVAEESLVRAEFPIELLSEFLETFAITDYPNRTISHVTLLKYWAFDPEYAKDLVRVELLKYIQ